MSLGWQGKDCNLKEEVLPSVQFCALGLVISVSFHVR